ncbi:UNVERIFIED_CONTAM: hypothetical protein Sradi_7043500 [Sesamum radiatum]|uniref:Reverse transcriptase domain-containing protein n=1 Tax=Sesamum radiatum TaxID=300843 RepID=A0AAW2J8U1_SESRA
MRVLDGDVGSLEKLVELKHRWERRFPDAVPRRLIPRFPSKLTFLPRRSIVSPTLEPIEADQRHSSRDSPTVRAEELGHTQEIRNSCNNDASIQNQELPDGPVQNQTEGPVPEVFVGKRGEIVIKPTPAMVAQGSRRWASTAVGYFLGRRPYFPQLEAFVRANWKGLLQVSANSNGFYFFRFRNLAFMEEVIEEGPWLFQGQPVVLQQWEQGMSLRKQKHTKVPVWIRIRHLPMEYWTEDGLSAVASGVGTPLYTDKITKTCSRLDFARVCVMLDYNSKLPRHLVVLSPVVSEATHIPIKVDIEYEWLPLRCKQCCSLGHTAPNCPETKVTKVGPPLAVYVRKQQGQSVATSPRRNGDVEDTCAQVEQDLEPSTSKPRITWRALQPHLGQIFHHRLDPHSYLNVLLKGRKLLSITHLRSIMITIASWNVRGLNGVAHQHAVGQLVRDHGIQFLGVFETRVRRDNAQQIQDRLLPGWSWFDDYAGPGGRIWLSWNAVEDVHQVFDNGCVWGLRAHSASAALGRASSIAEDLPEAPWSVLGDFNAVLDVSESCGRSAENTSAMAEFRDVITEVGLIHIPFTGCPFTWHNCSEGSRSLWRRLDRVLVNEIWLAHWPHASYLSALPGTSDHSPLVLRGRFKVFRAQRKTKGDLALNVTLAKSYLDSAQILFDTFKEDIFLHLVHWCRLVYCRAVELEASMLRQRAKMSWLTQGDQCSKYFFGKINARRSMQRVYQIQNSAGQLISGSEQVAAEFVTFFQSLLGGTRRRRILNLDFVQPYLQHTLTIDEANALLLPITHNEIKAAFFDISEDSAPGRLLKQLNATLLVLLPKVQLPVRVSEFRPIACCNVLYKAITKIIVRRMQQVLHLLIDYSQNAFVPGRSIADNILLAQELLVGYNQVKLPQRCTIKVDIQKAYDSVQWDFILECLRVFRFPSQFISWIEQCITSAMFSISLNGSVHGFFAGTVSSVRTIKSVLTEFAALSGLHVNPEKSTIILSKSVQQDRQSILDILGFQEGSLPIKYLGLPLTSSRLKLIKSVLNSLHTYWASVFILPKAIVKIIEGKVRSFLWKGSTSSGHAKVAWAQICKTTEEGGLGVRSVLLMNQALMLKQVWRILQEDPRSIWVAWVLRHRLRNQSIWTLNVASLPWFWKKLVKICSLLKDGLVYRVGDGCKFQLWNDIWHPRGPLIRHYPRGPSITGLPSDSLLMTVMHQGQWCWPSSTHFDIQQIIAELPTIGPQQFDTINWKSGQFTTQSVYALLQPPSPRVFWHQLLGGKFKIPRHDFILWLAILGRLTTMDRLWAQNLDRGCVLCGGNEVESHSHLFFDCSFSRRCLVVLNQGVRFPWLHRGWDMDVVWASRRWRGKHLINAAYRALFASIVYGIWRERNCRRFSATATSAESVGLRAMEDIRCRIISTTVRPSLQLLVLYRIWRIPWIANRDV